MALTPLITQPQSSFLIWFSVTLDKDCPPSIAMVFLRIQLDTLAMTMSVTPEGLQELLNHCSSILNLTDIPCHNLQSLLGIMSFVTACIQRACILSSSSCHPSSTHFAFIATCLPALSEENKSDLRWWCHFLPFFNGVFLIKTFMWLIDSRYLTI